MSHKTSDNDDGMTVEISGTAYTCPDYTDAYDILPKEHWSGASNIGNLNEEKLAQVALSGYDETFAERAADGEFNIIVAGDTFGGGGKSIEHPIIALRGAGIDVVVAESFARYFYRNAINNRLPVLQCEGILDAVSMGDHLSVNLESGQIENETTGETLQGMRLPEVAIEILESGGGIDYAKQKQLQSDN